MEFWGPTEYHSTSSFRKPFRIVYVQLYRAGLSAMRDSYSKVTLVAKAGACLRCQWGLEE